MGNIGGCTRDSSGGSLVHHTVRPFASARQVMKQRGFTLAELAIVVTVIGLMIFAVLKGQSLIGQAKAKDVIAIVDGLRNSTTFFRQRYRYLPGDWPYTANEIPNVTAATTVGTNGDGILDGSIDAQGRAQLGSEVAELPWQLYSAGFVEKIDSSDAQRRLTTSFGPVHVVSSVTAEGLVPGFAAANPSARSAIVFSRLACDVVAEVDAKIDDSVTTTGRALGTACNNGSVLWYAVVL